MVCVDMYIYDRRMMRWRRSDSRSYMHGYLQSRLPVAHVIDPIDGDKIFLFISTPLIYTHPYAPAEYRISGASNGEEPGGNGSPLIRGSVVNLIVIVVRVYCILYCNTMRLAAYRWYMDATTATTLYYR